MHAHYAIPHATAAYLARQILGSKGSGAVPRVITTLHGTDITLLGSDPSYSETVAFCIEQSNGVTAVSESLRADTIRELGVTREIRVIPNFVDCTANRRREVGALRARLAPRNEKLLIHVSNFRPVKRVKAVVEVFACARGAACLLMVGDGPDPTPCGSPAVDLRDEVDFLASRSWSPLRRLPTSSCCPRRRRASGLARSRPWPVKFRWSPARGRLPEAIQEGVNASSTSQILTAWRTRLCGLTDEELHRRAAAVRQTAEGRALRHEDRALVRGLLRGGLDKISV